MSQEQLTYRKFLREEFERRSRKNPGYSLRAYARDLDIPAPKLSQTLNGKCGISTARAARLAKKLNLSEIETQLFVSLAEAEHGRSSTSKLKARNLAQAIQTSNGFDPLSLERFRIIRDWYYFAILELTDVEGFCYDFNWIAKKLKIPDEQIKEAIRTLLDFGLLKEDSEKGLIQTSINLATPSGIPSRELREHHSQILQRADRALEEVDIEMRDFSEITMAIDSNDISQARQWIKEFRRKFCKDMQKSKSKDRVYSLAIQFFPLDKNDET